MIVFKPETVTKLRIAINTKDDADLLRALAICANSHIQKIERNNPRVQFMGVDNSVSWDDLEELIEQILKVTMIYSKEFVN